jgi:hypothetical protein
MKKLRKRRIPYPPIVCPLCAMEVSSRKRFFAHAASHWFDVPNANHRWPDARCWCGVVIPVHMSGRCVAVLEHITGSEGLSKFYTHYDDEDVARLIRHMHEGLHGGKR